MQPNLLVMIPDIVVASCVLLALPLQLTALSLAKIWATRTVIRARAPQGKVDWPNHTRSEQRYTATCRTQQYVLNFRASSYAVARSSARRQPFHQRANRGHAHRPGARHVGATHVAHVDDASRVIDAQTRRGQPRPGQFP